MIPERLSSVAAVVVSTSRKCSRGAPPSQRNIPKTAFLSRAPALIPKR